MQKNDEKLWNLVVDVAKPDAQLEFVKTIVQDLASHYEQAGELPECREIRTFYKGEFIALRIHPMGAIGEKLKPLAAFMENPSFEENFHVSPATLLDSRHARNEDSERARPSAALKLFYDGFPVLTIAKELDRLNINMDDFEHSIVILTAKVPRIWERVRRFAGKVTETFPSRESAGGTRTKKGRVKANAHRQEKLRQRQEKASPIGKLGLLLPKATIRPVEVNEAAAGLGGGVLLTPIRGKKQLSGGYPSRKVLETLRVGLGVQVVLAEHGLWSLLGDRHRAIELLDRPLLKTHKHLRELGLEALPTWTALDNERAVRNWAEARFQDHVRPRREDAMSAQIEAEMASVIILSKALAHAERIVVAHDHAEAVETDEAAAIIEQAYEDSSYSAPGLDELFQIAVFGNINSSTFWGVPGPTYVELFEAARAMGRVQAGAEAILSPPILRVVLEGRDATSFPDTAHGDVMKFVRVAALAIAGSVGEDNLWPALEKARDTGQYVLIERRARRPVLISAKRAAKVMRQR
ncbi:hypothetical protein [Pelagibacterium lacus]|uniref:Uncharacterized protein n=1 Tax=Pelagibacterium lacus TaxID=2282655 RepID=A0A369W368_9HYPH|nr:hypothetical protein [Pelagibacterium lacus]RDE07800.1 hypothetical protein DVH29_14825 [Pelagibacterium lacus]